MLKRIFALSLFAALALGVVVVAMSAAPAEAQTPGPYPEVNPVYVNGTYIAGSCTQGGFQVDFGTPDLAANSRYTISMAVFDAQRMDTQTTNKLPVRLTNNALGFLNSLNGAAVTLDTYTGDLIALRLANQLTNATTATTFTVPFGQYPLTGDDAGIYSWTGGTVTPYTQLWTGADAGAQTPVTITANVNTHPPTWDVVMYLAIWPRYGLATSTSYTAYGIDCWPDGGAPTHSGRVRVTSIWTGNAAP